MSLKEVIEKILADAGRPLHYKEITKIALQHKHINSTPRPEATVSARLSVEMKKGVESAFTKVSAGTYALKSTGRIPPPVRPTPEAKISQPAGTNLQVGKAGEYLVASELLFRGFDVWIPSVDSGTDLVAEKDRDRFNIQVKTGNLLQGKFYQMLIGIKSFDGHSRSGTFYVFVMRDGESKRCVVLSSGDIERMLNQGTVKKAAGKYYVVRFFPHEGTYILGKKGGEDMRFNIDNWGIIK